MTKRKTSTIPSRIWSFGAREPTQGMELLREQLWLAHNYWNTLTRIELDRRAAVAKAEEGLTEEDKKRSYVIKKEARAAMKKHPEAREAIKAARDVQLHAIPGYAAIDAANAAASVAIRQARAERGNLHFGTYLLVEKSMEVAKTKADPPRFRRWRSQSWLLRGGKQTMMQGRLGAHIGGGASPEDLRNNQMLQIEWPEIKRDDTKWLAPRSERRRLGKTVARIRAGSDEKRKPLWVAFPVTIHRPLPADARIKGGWLLCRPVGTGWKYELQLQVQSASFKAHKPLGCGTVALDLCWRRREGAIRIAYARDTNGNHFEILMPEDVLLDLKRADSIKGFADQSFDNARDVLADDLGSLVLSEPMSKQFEALRKWKSPQRLVRAICWWCDNRFEGDATAFDAAWTWMKRWRHLYQYATGIRVKALGRRKKYYEDIAAQLCPRYEKVVLGDFDMRDTVERDKKAKDAPKGARHNRFAASPSEFRLVIKSTAVRAGAEVKAVDCANATRECSACGKVLELDPFVIDFTCACGATWDRSHNHCVNLLKRARASVPPGSLTPLAPMFPQVLALHPDKRRRRKGAAKRRSKGGSKSCRIVEETTQAVAENAQEIGS